MRKKINIQKEIKAVMGVQGNTILSSRRYISPQFKKAVEMIYQSKGKLIITGVGKSGIVGQKIASTLASTGTDATYLHPVEGMHGNLGVVHKNDLLLAIGKSGESEEILNILPAVKKIGAKIISLTSNKSSTLAKQSDLVLYVPIEKEACPLNLAPTTSSTVHLVVGDAIAVALMKIRGFKSERFALYHPGGSLGKSLLLTVSDVMRSGKDNPVVSEKASVQKLLIEMTRKMTGAASIVNSKKKLIGLITDFDLRKAFAKNKSMSDLDVKTLMNRNPISIALHEKAVKALSVMQNRKKPFSVLPVVDKLKRPVGMIHLHDLVAKGLTLASLSSKKK